MYKWDLHIAPVDDDLLLGLDFMVRYYIDLLLSHSILLIDGKEEIPTILKHTLSKETFGVGKAEVCNI